jgi:hypothetical protein
MAKKQKEEPMVKINGTEHKMSDLTEEQLVLVNHVADLENKMRSAKFNVEQLEGGHSHFMDKLNGSFKSNGVEVVN